MDPRRRQERACGAHAIGNAVFIPARLRPACDRMVTRAIRLASRNRSSCRCGCRRRQIDDGEIPASATVGRRDPTLPEGAPFPLLLAGRRGPAQTEAISPDAPRPHLSPLPNGRGGRSRILERPEARLPKPGLTCRTGPAGNCRASGCGSGPSPRAGRTSDSRDSAGRTPAGIRWRCSAPRSRTRPRPACGSGS